MFNALEPGIYMVGQHVMPIIGGWLGMVVGMEIYVHGDSFFHKGQLIHLNPHIDYEAGYLTLVEAVDLYAESLAPKAQPPYRRFIQDPSGKTVGEYMSQEDFEQAQFWDPIAFNTQRAIDDQRRREEEIGWEGPEVG